MWSVVACFTLLITACTATSEPPAAFEEPTATPEPTAAPVPTETPAPTPAAASASDDDSSGNDGDAREESIVELMAQDAEINRAAAECMVDKVHEVTGTYAPDLDVVVQDELVMGDLVDCFLEDAISELLSTESIAAQFVGSGYTQTEAECIATALLEAGGNSVIAGAMSDQQELAMMNQANECATPVGPVLGSPAPGDDPELDTYWDLCNDGDPSGCFDLFVQSESDSDYETFGVTCGGRVVLSTDCVLIITGASDPNSDYGTGFDLDEIADPGSPPPGEDVELDALWDRCNAEDADACDTLFFNSPTDSAYEAFGFTCGGRVASADCELFFADQ